MKGNARGSGYERSSGDWYVEPRWFVDALLDAEPLEGVTWDPACGGGTIPKAMADRGMTCLATDIADRGFGGIADFLAHPAHVHNIVTNPPYNLIDRWLPVAMQKASGKVVMLARLAWLEGQRRRGMFTKHQLARVWVSCRRVSMPPGHLEVKASGGSVAFAWFVFDHGHDGPATIGWLP